MWTHDGLSELQMRLISRNIIDLCGDVDWDMATYVRGALLYLKAEGSPDVQVLISSGGGEVSNGLDIYDMLRLYEGKTCGMVFGVAASMAAVILQACTTRTSAANARLLIHHINRNEITLDDLRKRRKVAEIRKEMEDRQHRIYEILSTRTCRSVDQIRATCARNREMFASEALEFGLIDSMV